MDINEIEENLNNFQSDGETMIPIILKIVAHNQAMLHALMDYQFSLISTLNPSIDEDTFAKEIRERTNQHLLRIQADISGQL